MGSHHCLRSLFSVAAVAIAATFAPVHALAAPPPGIPDGWSDGFVYAEYPDLAKAIIVLDAGIGGGGRGPGAARGNPGAGASAAKSTSTPPAAPPRPASYSGETFREVMQGSLRTADALAKIPVPMIILKADASPEARQQHLEAAKVMQKGKLVHIDGAAHNLHHDDLKRTVEVLNEFMSTL